MMRFAYHYRRHERPHFKHLRYADGESDGWPAEAG